MLQLPLWAPASDWRPPSLGDLPSWKDAKRVCLDTETKDPHLKELGIGTRRDGKAVGFSFAIEDGPSHYLPIRHAGGDNMDEGGVLRYLRDQAKHFTGDLVGANISYDLDYAAEEGIDFKSVRYVRDIQIADPLIYELHSSYSLKNIANRYGLPGKDEEMLRQAANAFGVDPKAGMWQLAARYVGQYATVDAEQPLQILRKQERVIDDEDLWDIYNLESEVTPVLVRMRRRGVRIDTDKLSQIEEWTLTEEAKALRLVKDQTGVNVGVGNVWKAEALAPALEAIGVKVERTRTNKPSIRAEALDHIDHPVAGAIKQARKVNKLRTTFAASIRRYMINGRIHCTFNQIAYENDDGDMRGARYGRLSAADPNLQQQPSRDEFAKMWRSIYLPEEGARWACCDYSQQEPRWTTHFAALCEQIKKGGITGAIEAAQAYHDDPNIDNHEFMSEITGVVRKEAKIIYLGLCYGKGGAKLCIDLGLPTRWAMSHGRGRGRMVEYFETRETAMEARHELGDGYVWEAAGAEGQTILDKFDERAPFIRKLAKFASEQAGKNGFITTGGGRKLHFPQRKDGTFDWLHKALNRIIQGTSADQTKKAIVAIDRAGYWLMLQVHDETDNSVASVKEAKEIGDIMENVMPGKVPFRVDVELGDNWGELEMAA